MSTKTPLDRVKADFRLYLQLCWRHLGLPSPTRMQYDVAHWMQTGPNRQCIMCFRGFGKSYIDSAFQNWLLLNDQSLWTLQVSSNKTKADDKIAFRRRLIKEMPITRHLQPPPDARDSAVQFDVSGCRPGGSPSARSLGITSNMLQGSRANDIGADDIESRQNSQTALMHERVWTNARELGGAILTPAGEGWSRIRFFGTPQLEGSGYFDLATRGYATRVYPARYPTPEELPYYNGNLAPMLLADLERDPGLAGQPTEPERFDDKELDDRLAEYRAAGFAMQFMLLPFVSEADKRPLKLRDLVVMDLDRDHAPEKVIWNGGKPHAIPRTELPSVGLGNDEYHRPAHLVGEYRPYTRKLMSIDPAGRGPDELGWACGAELNSQVFVLDFGGYRVGTDESTLRNLALKAVQWGVSAVYYERTWGGGMWGQLFGPVLRSVCEEKGVPPIGLEEVHGTGRKELRIIDTLEPVLTQHRMVVDQSAIARDFESAQEYGESALDYQLAYQMTRITRDRGSLVHDDRLDALEILCRVLVANMGKDIDHERHRAALDDVEQMMEMFTGSLIGRPVHKPKLWIP